MVSLPRVPDVRIARCRALGFVGSALLTLGTFATGALPVAMDDPFGGYPVVSQLRSLPAVALGLTFLGLTLLLGAWIRLGAVLKQDALERRPRTPVAEMATTLAWWTAPLLVAPPLYSRDVYSYLVQGAMFAQDWDPYRIAPVIYGADNISEIWWHSTAPYGPVFLGIAALVTMVAGSSVVTGVLLMRLVMVASLVVIARCVTALARRYGVDPARALWLGVLNPLVLAHLIGGVHNDALMLALMLAGLLAAQRDRIVEAAVLIGLAVLVKATAGLALVFVVPAAARWLHARGRAGGDPSSPGALVRGAALVGVLSGAVVLGLTAATRSGYGWLGGLGDTVSVHNGLSLVTDVGRFYEWLGGVLGITAPVDPIAVARLVGGAAALGVILVLLTRLRGRPVLGVGLGLGAVVLLGPVVHPWYLLWALVPIAASTRSERLVRVVAALSVVMAYYPMPSGGGPTGEIVVGVMGALVGIAYLRRNPLEGLHTRLGLTASPRRLLALLVPAVREIDLREAPPAGVRRQLVGADGGRGPRSSQGGSA